MLTLPAGQIVMLLTALAHPTKGQVILCVRHSGLSYTYTRGRGCLVVQMKPSCKIEDGDAQNATPGTSGWCHSIYIQSFTQSIVQLQFFNTKVMLKNLVKPTWWSIVFTSLVCDSHSSNSNCASQISLFTFGSHPHHMHSLPLLHCNPFKLIPWTQMTQIEFAAGDARSFMHAKEQVRQHTAEEGRHSFI